MKTGSCPSGKVKYRDVCLNNCPLGNYNRNGFCLRECPAGTKKFGFGCYEFCQGLSTPDACVASCPPEFTQNGNDCVLNSR